MLRRLLAEDRDVPPFVVFGDASLRHMAAAVPQTTEEFSRIHGVGEAKLAQYGPDFLTVIRNFAKVNGLPVRHVTGAGIRAGPITGGRRGRRAGKDGAPAGGRQRHLQ